MKTKNLKEVKTIDCTPTWSGMLPTYIMLLNEGNEEQKKAVKSELITMAKVADGLVSLKKGIRKELIDLYMQGRLDKVSGIGQDKADNLSGINADKIIEKYNL